MRGLLIANADDADAGYVGHRFREVGYSFTECLREFPTEWPELARQDLVLLLGSEWSVYWPLVAAAVDAETAVVRAAHEAGVPVFGICFGSQLVARALGGNVRRAPLAEIGWYEVDSDVPEAVAPGPWLQWHADVVTVPPRATELARNGAGPQAWHVGRTLCTQFHPEATETILDRWTDGGAAELEQFGSSRAQLMAATRANVEVSRAHAIRLVDWFCETFAGRPEPVQPGRV